ncbi:MAG: glycosyltransferase [Desulfovibrionaceae bacterium]
MLTIACYSFDDPNQACARLRVLEPARALGKAVRLLWGAVPQGQGHRVRHDILETADVVLIQRVFPFPGTAPLLETIFASGKPVVYDTDDDWTSLPASHTFFPDLGQRLPLILDTARRAHLVTVSTPTLAAIFDALDVRHVRVVPNSLPEALWPPTPPPDRPVTAVGLAATPTHRDDLAVLEGALSGLAGRLGREARWVFFGCPPQKGLFPGSTVLPFSQDYGAYAARLPRLGLAIGLAPLADTPFNRAKSPIKWMEYAACGLAGVFADLPPYQGVVEQERTGLLVGPDPKDWCQAVERLVRDAALRKRLAHQAWEAVSREHLLSARAVLYLEAWQAATQRGAP